MTALKKISFYVNYTPSNPVVTYSQDNSYTKVSYTGKETNTGGAYPTWSIQESLLYAQLIYEDMPNYSIWLCYTSPGTEWLHIIIRRTKEYGIVFGIGANFNLQVGGLGANYCTSVWHNWTHTAQS